MLLINLGVLLVFLAKVGIICGQDIHSTTQGHSWYTQVRRKESNKEFNPGEIAFSIAQEDTKIHKERAQKESDTWNPQIKMVELPGPQKMLKVIPRPRNGQKTYLRITSSKREGEVAKQLRALQHQPRH